MIKKVAFLFLFFQMMSIILQSCGCEDKGKIIGMNSSEIGRFDNARQIEYQDSGYYEIEGAFYWRIYAEVDRYAERSFALNELYATSPCEIETWTNVFNNRSFKLYFSDMFVYQSDSINPRTNINSLVSNQMTQEEGFSQAVINYDFDSLFMSQVSFDTNLVYTLYFEGFTSDSIALSDSVNIKFNL